MIRKDDTMNLNPKLDIFKKIDDLFPRWRQSKGDKGSIFELMLEAFHLDSKESCKNILTLKTVFIREVGPLSELDDEGTERFNEICMRLDQLYKFFERCCSEWVLLEDFKECKTCQELFDVLDSIGICDVPLSEIEPQATKSIVEEDIDPMSFLKSVGDSRQLSHVVTGISTAFFKKGERDLQIAPSWYFRDINNLARPYYDVVDYPTFTWNLEAKPRLFYIGPGRSIDQIISENEATIQANKNSELIVRYGVYTRLCLIKSVLSGMLPASGFICIMPNVTNKKIQVSIDGKSQTVQLHKCKYNCSSPEEQAMVNSGLQAVNKNIGTVDIEFGDTKVPVLFV